ncbi:MAG: hypothetical protein M3Q07_00950, partial [Pseudobdellovibrionaceae bacterium]|nr:hypothetical protein [Pseudobdellovibrionaceae bacterium]
MSKPVVPFCRVAVFVVLTSPSILACTEKPKGNLVEYADSKTTATKSDDVIQDPVVDPAEPGMNPLCEAESSPEMFSNLGEPVEVPLPFPFEFTE